MWSFFPPPSLFLQKYTKTTTDNNIKDRRSANLFLLHTELQMLGHYGSVFVYESFFPLNLLQFIWVNNWYLFVFVFVFLFLSVFGQSAS
jgi:hypothetical protein